MKEIRCDTFQSLLLALDHYKGRIWGFTLFAHGAPNGAISDKRHGGITNWQDELLNQIQRNNYKLGCINLMQCFSGYKGMATMNEESIQNLLHLQGNKLLEEVQSIKYILQPTYLTSLEQEVISYVRTMLESQQYITVRNLSGIRLQNRNGLWGFTYYADIEVNWEGKWENNCLKLYSYQHENVCLIDMALPNKIVERIKAYIKNSLNSLSGKKQ